MKERLNPSVFVYTALPSAPPPPRLICTLLNSLCSHPCSLYILFVPLCTPFLPLKPPAHPPWSSKYHVYSFTPLCFHLFMCIPSVLPLHPFTFIWTIHTPTLCKYCSCFAISTIIWSTDAFVLDQKKVVFNRKKLTSKIDAVPQYYVILPSLNVFYAARKCPSIHRVKE